MFFKFFWDKFYWVAQAGFVNVFPRTQSPLRQPWCPRYTDEADWDVAWRSRFFPGESSYAEHIGTQSFLSLTKPLCIFESVFHVSSFSLPPLLLSLLYFESSSPDLLRSRLTVPPASCLFPLKSTSHKPDEAIYLQPKFYHFLKPLYHPGAAAKSLLGSYHLCQLASLCN